MGPNSKSPVAEWGAYQVRGYRVRVWERVIARMPEA